MKKYVDEEQLNNIKTLLADSLWQDIAGYSTTRRNIASNSKLSAYSFTGSEDYCIKINDYTWSMKSSVSYAGIQIDGSLFEEGETYTLSYKYRKQSGTLENIGGHSTSFTTLLATIDGISAESNESTGTNSYGNVFPVTNDTNEHFCTDAGHGIALVNVTTSGAIDSVEVVPRNNDTTLDTDIHAIVGIFTIVFTPAQILDSFCNEFHWKRVE